ncbi:hypothetical protein CIB87_09275 [Priestia megaterium]|uniref:DUF3311 domain-containing protein n=1 Tax=Priestia megaterium TaxID=1404 RepID=A0AA86HZM7_PRIMG|nr:DUF3311 domain-containing protein [Priestia megaterium]AXI29195.1 hypothetical protein CIB87_09275 [Priestia megaterium]
MKMIYLLCLLPFVGILGLLPLVNKVTPFILGMPFFLFWIVMWVILTSFIMGIVYKLDPAVKGGDK